MKGCDGFEDVGTKGRERCSGEEEREDEVKEDCESEEVWGGAECLTFRPLEMEDFGVVH